jgi:transposase
MAADKQTARREYSAELKAQVLVECEAHGASVAKVAMARGINANVVHRWRQLARESVQSSVSSTSAIAPARPQPHSRHHPHPQQTQFLPVTLAAAAPLPGCAAVPSSIEVEVRRGAVTMKLTWPTSALADFAAWTREVLV